VQQEHKKTICDYFTGPKKRKIGTALSWRKTHFILIIIAGSKYKCDSLMEDKNICRSPYSLLQ
jgi:hypothetical protein